MIRVELIGGLGNQLFQYSLGRILADEMNCNLYVSNVNAITQHFSNATNITDRRDLSGDFLHVGYQSDSKYVQHVNLEEVTKHQGPVSLCGFFQKHWLYFPYREKLKSIFSISNSTVFVPSNNDLVVHVRLGDYVTLNHYLQYETYRSIISNANYEKCYIITDQPNNIIIKQLLELQNINLFHGSVMEDFTFIYNAKQTIISQSTFSWWATFLGKAEVINVPLHATENGYPWKLFPQNDDIDLIPNLPNYIKHKIC